MESLKQRLLYSLTPGNILKAFIMGLITVILCHFISNYNTGKIKEILQNELILRSKSLENRDGGTLDSHSLKCILLDCAYFKNEEDILLKRKKDNLFISKGVIDANKDMSRYRIVEINNVTYYLNNQLEDRLLNATHTGTMITGLTVFVLYLFYIIFSYNNRRFIYRTTKDKLEDLIQKELTESLHHELSGPLAVIESNIIELTQDVYPEYLNLAVKCKNGELGDNCEDYSKELTSKMDGNVSKLSNAVGTIRDVLNIMANRKHFKYTNGTISLERLIDNAAAYSRIKHMHCANIFIENKELVSDYSLKGLENGVFVNILNNMITNSKEAGANKITFIPSIIEKNGNMMLVLDVKDNGRGIRNRKGEICYDTNIFKYSYSTKGQELESKSTWLDRLKALLGNINDIQSVRGAGLAISKNILNSTGGDITLKETSSHGTTFRIHCLIKKRAINLDESKLITEV